VSGDQTLSLHGVAVALGDIGLLIRGRSGTGKSRFAAGLIADRSLGASRLVADDRVLIARHDDRLIARPHPLIAGLIEIRGVGISRANALDAVVLRAVVDLEDSHPQRLPENDDTSVEILGINLPKMHLKAGPEAIAAFITNWPYFRDHMTIM
jgi:HPr kinase/phosphorylase